MLVCFIDYLPVSSTKVNHSLFNCQYVTVTHTYAADRLAHHLLQGESVEKAAVRVISMLWSGRASRPGMHKFHYLSLILNLPPYREGLLQAQQERAPAAVSCYLPSAAGHSCLPGELLVHHFHLQMLTQMFFRSSVCIPQARTRLGFIMLLKIPIQNMFDCTSFLQLTEIQGNP